MPSAVVRLLVLLVAVPVLSQWACAASTDRFPLRTDGARLVDARGNDFRIVGDAAWTLIVALSVEEADAYLAARKAAGFNTVLVELIEPQFAGPANHNGDLPFPAGKEFTSPSPEYFAHATAVLDLALQHGFLVLLSPAYLGYQCGKNGWCQQMLRTPDPVLQDYGRYVGRLLARYPNLVWVHGGDVDPAPYNAMGKVEAVYRGIDAEAPGGLHTAHCSRNFSAIDCYDRPWLNVNTTYSDCEQTYSRVARDRERVTGMPSIYVEGRYEEEKSTPLCVRSQMWSSYLGGSAGHVFGNRRIWRFDDDWRDAIDTEGARAMTVAGKLLGRLPAVEATPAARGLPTQNAWSTAWARLLEPGYPLELAWTAATSRDQAVPMAQAPGIRLAYIPHLANFSYDNSGETPCWVDPRNGTIVPAAPSDGALHSPDGQDWLFVAEKVARICAGKTL